MCEPSKTMVRAISEVTQALRSMDNHDRGLVECDPKSGFCRQDGYTCPDCGVFVCAWHCWVGDDGIQYCPKDAGKHRKDGLPKQG